jgi:hypothetical protein
MAGLASRRFEDGLDGIVYAPPFDEGDGVLSLDNVPRGDAGEPDWNARGFRCYGLR